MRRYGSEGAFALARSATEIKSLITELEQPFISAPTGTSGPSRSLRERMRLTDDIIFSRYDYAKDVSSVLQQRVPLPPALLRHYKDMMRAALRDDIKTSLEPLGNTKRDESAADRMEMFEAHVLLRLDPEGYLREAIRDSLSTKYFFAGWLEKQDYVPPVMFEGEKDSDYADRAKREREKWFGYAIVQHQQNSVAYIEDNRRNVTLSAVRFSLPVIDLMERFSDESLKKDDPNAVMRMFGDHFGFLRAGLGANELSPRDLYQKQMEVCAVDDGLFIAYYADLGSHASAGNDRYHDLQEVRNPWGRNSLLLAEGVYNPDEPMAYRREPLLMALITLEHQKAMIKSEWISRAASPPREVETIPPEVARWMLDNPDQAPPQLEWAINQNTGRYSIPRSYGDVNQLENPVDATTDKLFDVLSKESAIATPGGFMSDPDRDTAMKDIPATTVLHEADERNRLLSEAKRSMCNLFGNAIDMIKADMRVNLNNHRKKGEPRAEADWDFSFTATGKEGVIGQEVKRGEAYTVTPQDLDEEFVRTIEAIDTRESTRAARRQEADQRWAQGTITVRERYEMSGVENVTDFIEEKTAEQLYQLEGPRIVQQARVAFAQFEAAFTGQQPDAMLANAMPAEPGAVAGDQGATMGNGTPPAGGGPAKTPGIVRMGSPTMNNTGASTTGVSG